MPGHCIDRLGTKPRVPLPKAPGRQGPPDYLFSGWGDRTRRDHATVLIRCEKGASTESFSPSPDGCYDHGLRVPGEGLRTWRRSVRKIFFGRAEAQRTRVKSDPGNRSGEAPAADPVMEPADSESRGPASTTGSTRRVRSVASPSAPESVPRCGPTRNPSHGPETGGIGEVTGRPDRDGSGQGLPAWVVETRNRCRLFRCRRIHRIGLAATTWRTATELVLPGARLLRSGSRRRSACDAL